MQHLQHKIRYDFRHICTRGFREHNGHTPENHCHDCSRESIDNKIRFEFTESRVRTVNNRRKKQIVDNVPDTDNATDDRLPPIGDDEDVGQVIRLVLIQIEALSDIEKNIGESFFTSDVTSALGQLTLGNLLLLRLCLRGLNFFSFSSHALPPY